MTPNAGKDVEQQELSLVVGMQNGAAFLEDCLAGSYKTKHIPTCNPKSVPWYLPKGVENLCLHKNRHKNVYSSFSH